MPKTGWKYTKQAPDKSKRNMLKRSNASSKPNRSAPKKNDDNMRSSDTIKRLKMYTNGKAIRNKEGTVVGGQFMMKDRAGDVKITGATGRIAPDRRWFGNTRVVGATELDRFREEMTEKVADPYSVVLKRKKLPMGLLQDAAELSNKSNSSGLLVNEPFEHAFGTKSRRKRVKLDQYLEARSSIEQPKQSATASAGGGSAQVVAKAPEDDASGYGALLQAAQQSNQAYQDINAREGIVPWGRDTNLTKTQGEGVDWVHEKKDDLFLKGQSKRIWAEFFKVVDCSDVVLHIIDARNVPGTRCTMIENHVAKNASHKHLVFVLNKIDLVPNWVAKRWIGELSKVRPTIAFHASLTHAFGKGALISLLRQFGKLHQDKKQISVGVIGYPNVGKSSVINTLISKKSCKVAPIPGETKIWQYITLFKRISLIDCPGVVVDTAGDTETDSVLKGVVRAERLENPEDFIDAICDAVRREHIAAQYGIAKDSWENSTELLEAIAKRSGRLLKGGEPCLRSAAIMLINDFQRGRLPHYVAPPELKEEVKEEASAEDSNAKVEGVDQVTQDLDAVGEEMMQASDDEKKEEEDDDMKKEDDKKSGQSSSEDEEEEGDEKDAPAFAAGEWDDED
mmetsp:Transcript_9684/g.17625  ORF Transcript_9684/g.17625 Transcript_9684/m.17625 type:complete len:622 (+) Transcript_9684:60-1925(+)